MSAASRGFSPDSASEPTPSLARKEQETLREPNFDHTLFDRTSPGRDHVAVAFASSPAAAEAVPVGVAPEHVASSSDAWKWWLSLPALTVRWIVPIWWAVSLVLAVGQSVRIIRFRRQIRRAVPAASDLVEEAGRISGVLGLRHMPELLVVADLGTPLLWCLGRPRLLLPARLVQRLPLQWWRGILTHELAHLRRGDHWVCRLELVVGLFWWWNPLYWLTRARLDAEAELACDAWVIWAGPKDRLSYAEALLDICTHLSLAKRPAPALGAAGSGRFFERRLTMILHDHVPCRISGLGVLGACLLVLFALPSWSAAERNAVELGDPVGSVSSASDVSVGLNVADIGDDDDRNAVKRDSDDPDDKADDDDEDDDDDEALARARADAKAALAKARAAAARAKSLAEKSKGKRPDPEVGVSDGRVDTPGDRDLDKEVSRIEKEIEEKLGPGSEFEKQIEKLGEKIGREMEAKFGSGSEFEKKMEAFGKEMEAKFGSGSDFAKKMEAFGKEMEAKFGSGSDFAKKMEAFGKEMEAKFGADSDWQNVKQYREFMKQKDGAESEFGKKPSGRKGAESGSKSEGQPSTRSPGSPEENKPEATAKDRKRERRIRELEAQISKLADEVKALKAERDEE
jgi:beta-lactamase regulating signal transducer with metallopeptidase domain